MNPFVLAREQARTACSGERALAAVEALIRDGFEVEDRRYRIFGGRTARYVTMSLGMPVLGGGAPVLRAWLRDEPGPAAFDVVVGARLEVIVVGVFWALVTVVGGSYQLFLQSSAVARGEASWSAVTEVLPGIGIMVGLLALGGWLFRRRSRRDTELLLEALRACLAAAADPDSVPVPGPIH